MSESDISEIKGLMVGMKEDITEIKKDIIHIRDNDKDKRERIKALETHRENDIKWREGHIEANQKYMKQTNESIIDLKNEIKEDKKLIENQKKDRNTLAIGVVTSLVGVFGLVITVIVNFL